MRAAATAISAVGALLGPLCLLAFPGLTSWRPEDLPGAAVLVPALLFVASPFAAFLVAARLSRTTAGAGVVAALALVALLFGALIYGDAVLRKSFVLLLLFAGVPMVQWLMALPAVVAALVLRRRAPPLPR
jgi:hypothetical protein